MAQRRKTEFVSVNITPQARDSLRAVTLEFSAAAGRRLSMSDALVHALAVARRHRHELVSDLLDEQG